MKETDPENPDIDFLREAAQAIRNLSDMALMRTFQSGMAKIPNAPKEWHQLVPKEVMEKLPKKEQKKQRYVSSERISVTNHCSSDALRISIIFELIYGEMEYVRDLETIDKVRHSIYRLSPHSCVLTIFPRSSMCSHYEKPIRPCSSGRSSNCSSEKPSGTLERFIHITSGCSRGCMRFSARSIQ